MYRKSKRLHEQNRYIPQLCCVCLSSDRTLTALGKLRKALQNITAGLGLKMVSTNLLCWECIALLKKVKQFKERAKKSQKLLKGLEGSEISLKPLSNLKVVAISMTSSHAPILEADVLLGEDEIKMENDDIDDYINVTVDENNHNLIADVNDDIKIKTDDPFNDDAININNDVFDERDYDDDSEIKFVEIDGKNSMENLNDTEKSNESENLLTKSKCKDELKKDDDDFGHCEDSNGGDPDYNYCPIERYTEANKMNKKVIREPRTKLIKRNSLSMKKIPITLDDVMVLWKKDRDSEYFKSLENKCDICLKILSEEVADHKQKIHLENLTAMDLGVDINTTIDWEGCIICQGNKDEVVRKPTEHSLKLFIQCYTERKIIGDPSILVLSYLLEGHDITDKEVQSKFKWHYYTCYSTFTNKSRIDGKRKSLEKRRALETMKRQQYRKCNICKTYWQDEKKLATHLEKHCVKFQCKMCTFETLLSHAMADHFSKNHARIVECLECGSQLAGNRAVFLAHFKELHSKINLAEPKLGPLPRCKHICDYCGKKWYQKSVLEKHIQKNHTPIVCKLCNKVSKNYSIYKTHVRVMHTVEKSEATFCVTCNKHFDNMMLYTRHIKSAAVHAEEMGLKKKDKVKVKCPECPKTYTNKYYMMDHYQFVHLKKSKHYCSICDKRFLSSNKYRYHCRIKHENYVPKKDKLCNYCGRGFAVNKILINHIRTHTGERPHECPQCDAKFAQETALKSHIKHIHMKISRNTRTNDTYNVNDFLM